MRKTPLQLKDLTEDQYRVFKTHIYNGVGSRDFFINPHDLIFKQAAEAHDLAYWVGGPDYLRKEADKIFLKEARKAVIRQRKYKRIFYFPIAYVYYYFLVLGGRIAFERYDEPATNWLELLENIEAYYIRNRQPLPSWLSEELMKYPI